MHYTAYSPTITIKSSDSELFTNVKRIGFSEWV